METDQPNFGARSASWRSAPVVALLLLSPVIGELLFGATRISTLFVLIPQIGTWGCAALIIRELVRRRRLGWYSMLLLGIALAVAEECVIQQTSLAPLVGADPRHLYGRALAVNWVYFLWALGYESVWIVVLPIQLTELMFPARRDDSWLSQRGMLISTVVFLAASFVAWYSWTQVFLPKFFPELGYKVPIRSILIALVAIVALTAAALTRKSPLRSDHGIDRSATEPWRIGLQGFALALPWFALIFLAYGALPKVPWMIPMIAGVALAGFAYWHIARISQSPAWQDSCRLALIFGAMIASMLAGFLVFWLGGATAIDVIGKLVLNVIAVGLLIALAGTGRSTNGRAGPGLAGSESTGAGLQ